MGGRQDLAAAIEQRSEPLRQLVHEVGRVIVGQEKLIQRMLIALISGGHLLIEGVPGLAKTTAVASLAKGISTDFQRLQFTPDLLPADLIGTQVYRPQSQEFVVQDRFLPIWYWLVKVIVPRQKFKVHSLRQCRGGRSPLVQKRLSSVIRSWSWRLRILWNRKAPIHYLKPGSLHVESSGRLSNERSGT